MVVGGWSSLVVGVGGLVVVGVVVTVWLFCGVGGARLRVV